MLCARSCERTGRSPDDYRTPIDWSAGLVDAIRDDGELLEKLVSIIERACQGTNTLRQSTPIEITVATRASSSV